MKTIDPVETAANVSVTSDRRRPGRVEYTNPHLIQILRALPDKKEGDLVPIEYDSLASAKGIGVAILFAIPIWAGLIWLFLKA
jgi:hypothetical protein